MLEPGGGRLTGAPADLLLVGGNGGAVGGHALHALLPVPGQILLGLADALQALPDRGALGPQGRQPLLPLRHLRAQPAGLTLQIRLARQLLLDGPAQAEDLRLLPVNVRLHRASYWRTSPWRWSTASSAARRWASATCNS